MTKPGPLSDTHINHIRETLRPGCREITLGEHEVRALLDEVEQHRIPPVDLHEEIARTRTIPTADEAIARYRATLEANASDMPGAAEDWTFALGFFLGLGLTLEVARHLSIRV